MDYSRSSILKTDHPLLATALAKRADPNRGTREQSYFDHVFQVYLAWRSLIDIHGSLIQRVATRHGIDVEGLLKSSLLCVAMHDVGKLSENFQRMMRARNDTEYRSAVSMNYRHEVIPLCVVKGLALSLAQQHKNPLPADGLLEVMTVAGHHKYLADGYLINADRFTQDIEWSTQYPLADSLRASMKFTDAMFREQGWKCPSAQLTVGVFRDKDLAWRFLEAEFRATCRLHAVTNVGPLREIFALLKGLLMTADWMASGTNSDHDFLNANNDTVCVAATAVPKYIAERNSEFESLLPFQESCASSSGHVLAIAPTGSGKTEAAMLWGLNQIESGAVKKLLFLMPTMVTANSLHRRLETFFTTGHGHRVSLVHSTADLIRAENGSKSDDVEDSDSRSNAYALRDPHLFAPVTVGTVDQLLVTLMHSGRWAIKTLAAANAAIVIDEVHAYDPHTSGLLMLLLRHLSKIGTRFMVMSATMPTDLRRAVAAALAPQAITTIEETTLLNSARNQWSSTSANLTEWLGITNDADSEVSAEFRELYEAHAQGDRPPQVLIVVNTVKRCQQIAEHLDEFEPVCYHSKFIFDHRREKEALIEDAKPRLLIATQVVEVSLDIDYDILLTECAPIDALIQRAGRVNRPRRDVHGQIRVFLPEEGSDRIYGEPRGVLDDTWAALANSSGQHLTEQMLLDMVESVYAETDIAHHDDFVYIQRSVRSLQQQLSGILDAPRPHEADSLLKTRLEKYAQESVIPRCFVEECMAASPKDRRKFELKVPLWYFQRFSSRDPNPDDLPICEMDYDRQLGARLLSNNDWDNGNAVY